MFMRSLVWVVGFSLMACGGLVSESVSGVEGDDRQADGNSVGGDSGGNATDSGSNTADTDHPSDNGSNPTDVDAGAVTDSCDAVAAMAVSITFAGSSAVTSDATRVNINGAIATINASGTYVISGEVANGQLIVNAAGALVKLVLDSVSLKSTSTSPFYVLAAEKAVIYLPEGSVSALSDGSAYGTSSEPSAALFANSDLHICGAGSLTVHGNSQDGISTDDGLRIESGTLSVTAKDDAIRGKSYATITGGTITASATTGHALKSDDTVVESNGIVTITGGTLQLTSASGDGVHATHKILVDGGTTTIAATGSQGLKAAVSVIQNGGSVNVTASKEGIESKLITFNDGSMRITASDDGINGTAGSAVENDDGSDVIVNGGYVYVNASGGDALDSNGSLTINGGTVVAHGPSQDPEVGVDVNGDFLVTGGTLVVSGTSNNMTETPSSSSTQVAVLLKFRSAKSANSIIHIQDGAGTNILTFAPARQYRSITLSSPALSRSTTYTAYSGGSATGTNVDGLYTGGTYTPGTSLGTFVTGNGTANSATVN